MPIQKNKSIKSTIFKNATYDVKHSSALSLLHRIANMEFSADGKKFGFVPKKGGIEVRKQIADALKALNFEVEIDKRFDKGVFADTAVRVSITTKQNKEAFERFHDELWAIYNLQHPLNTKSIGSR